VDRTLSDQITGAMNVVPHDAVSGTDCCGCIVAAVDGTNVELRCNECGAVLGVVQVDILKSLLGIDAASATCPHCGEENTFPAFSTMKAYVCNKCGKAVEVEPEM
jgi:hypothetical protein